MYSFPALPEEYEASKPAGDGLPCKELNSLKGHEGPVLAVRFNTQGTYCMSCGKVSKEFQEAAMHACPLHDSKSCAGIESGGWLA